MINKIIIGICYIFLFIAINQICRYNACYFPESLFKKHIIIKNEVLRVLLIGEGIGRDKLVSWHDSKRLPIFGLMSYVTLGTANLLRLVLQIMITFNCSWITDLNKVYDEVDDVFGILLIFNFVMLLINIFVIDYRRKGKDKKHKLR